MQDFRYMRLTSTVAAAFRGGSNQQEQRMEMAIAAAAAAEAAV